MATKPPEEESSVWLREGHHRTASQHSHSRADSEETLTDLGFRSGRAGTLKEEFFKKRKRMPKEIQYPTNNEYPWFRPPKDRSWSKREDQYLVDTTLQGVGIKQISEYLSKGRWIKRSVRECQDRIAFHTNRAAGGRLLPIAWVFGDRQRGAFLKGVPVTEQMLKNKHELRDDEYQELALFKYYGRYLYTRNHIFRDEISAARLRQCLKEMDGLDSVVFRRRVNYFKSRAELRRRPYIQGVKAVDECVRKRQEQAELHRPEYVQGVEAVEMASSEWKVKD